MELVTDMLNDALLACENPVFKIYKNIDYVNIYYPTKFNLSDLVDWCTDNISDIGLGWDIFDIRDGYRLDGYQIIFKRPHTKTQFLLRWS